MTNFPWRISRSAFFTRALSPGVRMSSGTTKLVGLLGTIRRYHHGAKARSHVSPRAGPELYPPNMSTALLTGS